MIIVIFGAAVRPDGTASETLHRRVEAAFRFGGPASDYMPTGGVGRYGPSEASIMADLLTGYGVAQERITLEETGTDTLSSARACAGLLRGRAGPVFAASSGYHLPRCLLLLRLAGVAARSCPAPRPAAEWHLRWYWRLREAAALPVDAAISLAGRIRAGRPGRRAGRSPSNRPG